jgi:hypothetical protein
MDGWTNWGWNCLCWYVASIQTADDLSVFFSVDFFFVISHFRRTSHPTRLKYYQSSYLGWFMWATVSVFFICCLSVPTQFYLVKLLSKSFVFSYIGMCCVCMCIILWCCDMRLFFPHTRSPSLRLRSIDYCAMMTMKRTSIKPLQPFKCLSIFVSACFTACSEGLRNVPPWMASMIAKEAFNRENYVTTKTWQRFLFLATQRFARRRRGRNNFPIASYGASSVVWRWSHCGFQTVFKIGINSFSRNNLMVWWARAIDVVIFAITPFSIFIRLSRPFTLLFLLLSFSLS